MNYISTKKISRRMTVVIRGGYVPENRRLYSKRVNQELHEANNGHGGKEGRHYRTE
jgi:hypothetical protein